MAARAVGKLAPLHLAALATALIAGWASAQGPASKESPSGIPIALPGGFVITIGPPKPPAKAGSVVLTAEQYKDLLDRLEKLQAQVDAQQPMRPRSCELEGKVESRGRQSIVRLKATFKFTTTKPNTLVHLGCLAAHAVEAHAEDGKAPLLTASDDGLRVVAESAGDHTIKLELDVPLNPRGLKGAELGFEIGLPGAPITALTFEPPPNVRRYNLTTKIARGGAAGTETEVDQPEVERFLPGKGGAPLGSITSLAFSWEDPGRKPDAVRSAEAEILVTVGTGELVTEAKLHLRGAASEWKFTAPASADVTVARWTRPGSVKPTEFASDRLPNLLRPDPGQSIWRIVFREPFANDLQVIVVTRQPRPKADEPGGRGPFPIGPHVVLGIPTQSGTIRIRAPSNLRQSATLRSGVTREVDDGSGDSIYRYQQAEIKTAPTEAPVTLTLTPIAGVVNARIRHELRLSESGWKLRSEIAVSPLRTEVDHLDIEVPASFRPLQAEPPEIVEELAAIRESAVDRPVYRARLSSPKRSSFTFVLEGDYAVPAGPGSATLTLPKLLGVTERSSELIASAPSRFDLRGSVRAWENGKPGAWVNSLAPEISDTGSRLRIVVEKPIAVAELVWRVAASTAVVHSEADVDIGESRVRVVQRLRFRFAGQVPDRVRLRSSLPLTGVQSSGGVLEPTGEGWDIAVSHPQDHEPEFTLAFSASVVAGSASIALPLLIPEAGDLTQSVRVWSSREGSLQLADSTEWMQAPTEIVAGRADLPALVLRSRGAVSPPLVLPRAAPGESELGASVDRARVDVVLSDADASYRCQYWVRNWRQDAEFALPPSARAIEVFVQGKRLANALANNSHGDGFHVTVRRPSQTSPLTLVELRYRGPASELAGPIAIRGLTLGTVAWIIHGQPSALAIVPGNTSGGWSLESFLNVLGMDAGFQSAAAESGVALRQTGAERITVYQVGRTGWVLAWSLAAFALSSVAIFLGRRARQVLAVVAIIGIVAAAFFAPQPLAQATFAAMPGMAAFSFIVLSYSWIRARHRRRIARAIGFARPGSSLVRPSVSRARDSKSREAAPSSSSGIALS
jgi:hypothetical protein